MSGSLKEQYLGYNHVTIIEPPKGWRGFDVKELWAYRELLWVLMIRDIKVRYKQTVLGASWAILQPTLTMMIFTIFFGRLANMPSDGFPYPVFVYAALLPWFFFANTVTASGNSVVGSANLVGKVYFPRLIIPLSTLGVGLLDFAISAVVLLMLMVFYGVGWSINLIATPLLIVAVVFTALGVGTLLSALNVAYRDFRYVIPFLVQFWLFATPVVYPANLVPEKWQWLFFLNPMAGFIEGFRSVFLGKPFDVIALVTSFISATLICIVGMAYFERVERRFADII